MAVHVVDWHNLYFAAGVGLFLARSWLVRCGVMLPLLLSCAAFWASLAWRYSGALGVQFAVAVGGLALWAALLCVALTNLERRQLPGPASMAWRALVAIGNWSYSLYLVHYLLMRPVELAVKAQIEALPAWSAEPIRWSLIAASLGLSWLLFRWVETPLIDLGHRLARRHRTTAARVGVS